MVLVPERVQSIAQFGEELVAPHVHDDRAPSRPEPVLEQIQPLPRSQPQLSRNHWNRLRGRRQSRSNVRRHIVGTLGIVPVNGITVRGRSLEPTFQILARGGIRVLLNQYAGRSVGDEDKTKAGLQTGLSYDRRNVPRDVVEPAAPRRETQRLLVLLHKPYSSPNLVRIYVLKSSVEGPLPVARRINSSAG